MQPIISCCIVGFGNYLAQIIINDNVSFARTMLLCQMSIFVIFVILTMKLKVKFTVRTYNLCIGINETYSCLAHNFVVGPASRIVR